MGTPKANSILWPKVPPYPLTWVPPQLQLNRERKTTPGSPGRVCLLHPPLHAEESEHKYLQYSHPLYPTEPRQILQAALPRGRRPERL